MVAAAREILRKVRVRVLDRNYATAAGVPQWLLHRDDLLNRLMRAIVEQGVERADLLEYLPPAGRVALVADMDFEAVPPPLQGLTVKVDADNSGLGPEPFAPHEEGAEEVPRQLGINAEVVGGLE